MWDRELVDFWRDIPISMIMDKFLFRTYLARYDQLDLFQKNSPEKMWSRQAAYERLGQSIVWRLRKRLESLKVTNVAIDRLGNILKFLNEYRSHPLGFSRINGFINYIFFTPAKRHSTSILLKDFLISQYGLDLVRDVARKRTDNVYHDAVLKNIN